VSAQGSAQSRIKLKECREKSIRVTIGCAKVIGAAEQHAGIWMRHKQTLVFDALCLLESDILPARITRPFLPSRNVEEHGVFTVALQQCADITKRGGFSICLH
jgi:hypothetical protein